MKSKHYLRCSAPVCAEDENKDLVWWAGEQVCTCSPLTPLQKKQVRINQQFKKGRFQDKNWTVKELQEAHI